MNLIHVSLSAASRFVDKFDAVFKRFIENQNLLFHAHRRKPANHVSQQFGLALVKPMLQMYHGEIKIESKGIGHDACFLFSLATAVTIHQGTSS